MIPILHKSLQCERMCSRLVLLTKKCEKTQMSYRIRFKSWALACFPLRKIPYIQPQLAPLQVKDEPAVAAHTGHLYI